MTSYKIAALPSKDTTAKTIRERIEAHSAFDQHENLRSGTLPYTLEQIHNDLCYFIYACEENYDIETLEGTSEVTFADKFTVAFLGNEYTAYQYCNQNIEQKILSVIGSVAGGRVQPEPIQFNEHSLHQVIDQSDSVRRADVAPNRKEGLDFVSGRDRTDLRRTDWWDQYLADPFEQIMVSLPTEHVEFDVGFDDRGKIILYGRSIPINTQVKILQYIVDEIVSEYVSVHSFQSNNWF
jgi:hypothetical protein